VHLADLHMDLNYQAGANWNCDEVICCRATSGSVTEPKFAARETGEYYCDMPYKTVDLMGQFIREEVEPEMIFYTGDIAPHNQWEYTLDEIKEYQSNVTAWMLEYFKDIPLYPIEGNHDFEVTNSQNFTVTDPIIPFTENLWKQWLSPEAMATFEKNGFYSEYIHLKDGTDFANKTRVIAVNTQPCYNMNFFLISTHKDGGDELAWLEDLLSEMEKKGENAILIGHVPTGDDCINNWAYRFNALMERYQHIVRT